MRVMMVICLHIQALFGEPCAVISANDTLNIGLDSPFANVRVWGLQDWAGIP